MKKPILYIFSLGVIGMLLMSNASGISNRNGAPSETTCNTSGCHTGNPLNDANGSIVITDNIPASGYMPGQTYSINVVITRNGVSKFGFGFEAVTSSNTTAGTLIVTNSAQTQLMAGIRTNIVHKLNGGLAVNTKTFSFNWTAPSTFIGNVTFYAAGNATNSNNNDTGDFIYTTSKVVYQHAVVTGSVPGSPFCGGSSGISIPFVASGTFAPGNIFTAEMSDASGSFASAVVLGTLAATSSGTIISTALPAVPGTGYRIRVTSSNPSVVGIDNGSNLVINAPPTQANAGANQSICSTNANLAGNAPVTGSGNWSLISGAGTIASGNSPSTSVTGLAPGANIFRWTISTGGCSSSISDATITSYAPPSIANAGADQTVCANFVTLSGNSPQTGTGTWTLVTGSGSITSASSNTTLVTSLGTGTNIFAWGISNGVCTMKTDTVKIVFSGSITVANAGPDQTICATTATLNANTASVGSGSWTIVSGTGTFASAANPSTAVSGLSNGMNIFRWTITNNPCTPTTDDVAITSVSVSPAITSASQTLCTNSTTLSANVPQNGTGSWSVIQGSASISSNTTSIINVSNLSPGLNSFVWTVANAPCTSSSATVNIVQNGTMSIASAGADQSVCGNSATLSATPVNGGSGAWTLISGNGIIGSSTSPLTIVNNLGYGNNVFRWTVNSGTCTPSTDDVIVTGFTVTTANAGNDQSSCATFVTLGGNTPVYGSGQWSVLSGSATIISPTAAATSLANLGTNVNVLRWTISNAPCPASFDDVAIAYCMSLFTSSVNSGPYCPSTSMSLPVAFTSTNVFPGYFIAQLSDITGNFPPNNAGVTAIGAGSASPVFATIPSTTAPGSSYRIRIVHSSPYLEGTVTGTIAVKTCTPDYVSLGGSSYTLSCTNSTPLNFTVAGAVMPPYVAELSNPNGVFNAPITLGYSYFSPVTVNLPRGLQAGNNYRLRIRSAASGIISDESGAITIDDCSTVGIDFNGNLQQVLLYPSSTSEYLNIECGQDINDAKITITDISGRIVYQTNMILKAGNKQKINVSNFQEQLYIVNITSSKGSTTTKFIKD